MHLRATRVLVSLGLIAGVTVGCSSVNGPGHGAGESSFIPSTHAKATSPQPGQYIKHVVIIVQENRTFENIFAGYPKADAPLTGTMLVNGNPTSVPLHAIDFNACNEIFGGECDPGHSWSDALDDYDGGKMDGFATPAVYPFAAGTTFVYAHLQPSLVQPYWTMAQRYTLADHMFPTEFGQSFTGHLFLVSSNDEIKHDQAVVDNPNSQPWGCSAPRGTTSPTIVAPRKYENYTIYPCFTQWKTLADSLDDAKISWKYYAPGVGTRNSSGSTGGSIWSVFDAISSVCHAYYKPCEGADWNNNVVSPQTKILTLPSKGTLPAVTWVIPDYADSDHSENGSDAGPSWVAAVVNAIGKSKYWDSTAIFVVWDDWGGWYDNVAPPQRDFRGLGIRVPFLIVSPWAKRNYVSHTVYEFGSIIRFVNETFGLKPLGLESEGYTDTRAAKLDDSFDFTQRPQRFKVIPAKYSASRFLNEKPSLRAPDDD